MLLADSKENAGGKNAKEEKAAAKAAEKSMSRQAEEGEVEAEAEVGKQNRVKSPVEKSSLSGKNKSADGRYYIEDPEQQVRDQQETYHFAVWTSQGNPYFKLGISQNWWRIKSLCQFIVRHHAIGSNRLHLFEKLDLPMYQKHKRHPPSTTLRVFATTRRACLANLFVFVPWSPIISVQNRPWMKWTTWTTCSLATMNLLSVTLAHA